MSHDNSQAQTRLDIDDRGSPIVIDVEGALDDMYRSLGSERRRILISVLATTGGQITVDELTEAVTRREFADDGDQTESELRQQVKISLYHNHLPTLAERDLIEFDPDSMVVEDLADTISLVTA